MAGPSLELFKFAVYIFVPVSAMIYFGDPDWYVRNVKPIRDEFWPRDETLHKPPQTREGVKEELERLKDERLEKRRERLGLGPTPVVPGGNDDKLRAFASQQFKKGVAGAEAAPAGQTAAKSATSTAQEIEERLAARRARTV